MAERTLVQSADRRADLLRVVLAKPFPVGTEVEQEVARLASRGWSSVRIGVELGIPTNTVGTILKRYCARIGVHRKADLTELVFRKIERLLTTNGARS